MNRLREGGPSLASENPASVCFGNTKLVSLTAVQRAVASVPTVVLHPGCGADKPTMGTALLRMSMVSFEMPTVLPTPFSTVYR